jgi:asparagine synthase (glutamine-hydrolysing)
MCGIAGFIDPDTAPESRATAVERMCAAMVHRGPDDAGIESRSSATLGMRRLAIFDPANGHQPMQSPDRRFTLVFNGAIYNFRTLRDELSATGWSFRTQCDTEVLLAAYAYWGERCLDRLRGMFAFAVWDEREQSLFLARDPFGIKPLYYRHEGSKLLLASELNALFASGSCPTELDPLSVADYLGWFAVPAPRTIYRSVFSLRPGECATFRGGQLAIRPAWNFQTIPQNEKPCRTREHFTQELRARLEDTIRAHVAADVPVGAFLSGGLDSAVVVGLMSRVTNTRLRTFSLSFEESSYSEASAAEASARHFGTDHQTTVLTGARVAHEVETLIKTMDQPTGDGINTYYASQAARSGGVTVALSGLGGDELFGGYPSFRDTPRIARWLPRWRAVPSRLRSGVIARLQRGDTRRRKLADFLQHARSIHEAGSMQRRVFSETSRRSMLGPDALLALGQRAPFHPELAPLSTDLAAAAEFEVVSAWELRTYMADVLLRDSDVMSMRHSLELRVPLVDRVLIEWLWQQPSEFKSTPDHPKAALSAAVADILPPGMANRQKQGFTLPFAVWMKRELRPFLEETFSNASVDQSGLFARTAVQQLWQGFQSGNDTREWSRVWSLAILVAFANRHRAGVSNADVSSGRQQRLELSGGTGVSPVGLSRAIGHGQNAPATSATDQQMRSRKQVRHRTLLLAPEIFESEGGIPRVLQIYLRALCELAKPDEAVQLLALNDSVIDSSDLRHCTNGALEAWSVCDRSKTRFVRAALRMSRGCNRIVCGHIGQLPIAWLAARLNPKLRYYLVAHGIEVWRPLSAIERLALRGAARILCVSDYTRRELLKNCPLPEGRTVVLHNALDPAFAIKAGRPLAQCTPVILVVTRLTWADRYKGVQHMIEAMPAIRASIPGARMRIVGRGDDLPRLQALRRTLGLVDAIDFVGYIYDEHLAEEMRSCRLFALPSRKEGFGLVFLEAMAHGRPCLGARAGGIPEVITKDTGVLADYGDVPGIAAAAITALGRNWQEETILNRARHFAYPQFRTALAAVLG